MFDVLRWDSTSRVWLFIKEEGSSQEECGRGRETGVGGGRDGKRIGIKMLMSKNNS